jgi:hypothetical protein
MDSMVGAGAPADTRPGIGRTVAYQKRVATWAAAVTALAATLALGIGVFTPPRGGILCTSGCIPYPYTDAAPFVAADSLWIVPATIMILGFVVVTACLHELARPGGRLAGLVALALATLASALLVGDYAVHLMVVMPSLAKGEGDVVTVFSMYNPHGVFIALENAGYFVMGLAFLATAGAVAGTGGRLERAIRWVFLTAGTLAVGGLVVFAAVFGTDLDVRYEVAAISVDYLALIVGGGLLAVQFRQPNRTGRETSHPGTGSRQPGV